MPAPPAAARRVLRRILPRDDRDDLLETIDRLHARRVREEGRLRADLWYRWQVVDFGLRLALERIAIGPPRPRTDGRGRRGLHRGGATRMSSLLQDLRYGLRRLAKTPLLTSAVVVSLALAVGANGAILGAAKSLLLEPLPYEAPGDLVRVWGTDIDDPDRRLSLSYPNYVDLARAPALEGLAGYQLRDLTLSGMDGPVRITGVAATAELFDVLGVQPSRGRGFLADEDGPGGSRVTILSHELWRDRFDSDGQILGRTVSLDGQPFTVVGVAPPGVRYPPQAGDLWVPLLADESTWGRASGGLNAVGRLAEGADLEALVSQLEEVAARIEEAYPRWYEGWTATALTLPDAVYGSEVRAIMYALMVAAALLLLTACINVANLMLARSAVREREVAVRSAMGASRSRVLRLFLLESLALGTAGGALGIVGADLGLRALRTSAPEWVARAQQLGLDVSITAGTLALGAGAGLLFGLLPALRAVRIDPAPTLRRGTGGQSTGVAARRLQGSLITAQVALVATVLVGATLMGRSVRRLQNVDPGFVTEGRLTFAVSLTSEYDQPEAVTRFQHATVQQLEALGWVRSVGVVHSLPLGGDVNSWSVIVDGRGGPEQDGWPSTGANYASPDYFSTMGIPVVAGRVFTEADRAGSVPVVVVSDALAERFWPGESALGRRLALPGEGTPDRPAWRTVVGVVGNVRHGGLREAARDEMYLPWAQLVWPTESMVFALAAEAAPDDAAVRIREAVRAVDPGQAVYAVRPLEALVSERTAVNRGLAWLLGLFGVVALLLASVGIFGVVSHGVAQRRREIGIRAAMGAARPRLYAMVVREGLIPVAVGLAIGVVAASPVARLSSELLFEVGPRDPVTFTAVPLVLLAVAVAAVWLPARRAARIHPAEALRAE